MIRACLHALTKKSQHLKRSSSNISRSLPQNLKCHLKSQSKCVSKTQTILMELHQKSQINVNMIRLKSLSWKLRNSNLDVASLESTIMKKTQLKQLVLESSLKMTAVRNNRSLRNNLNSKGSVKGKLLNKCMPKKPKRASK